MHSVERRSVRFAILAFAAALIASRLALLPAILFHFDSVNFALALDDFNPGKHQPQPPGYPFFVALASLFAKAGLSAHAAITAAGLVLSGVALFFTGWLGALLFGRLAGVLGASLLLFHPAFWYASLTNPVRLALAAGGAVLLSIAARAAHSTERRWFIATGAAVGIAAGFRPELTILGMPVLLWAGLQQKRALLDWVLSLGALGVTSLAWIGAAAVASGGLDRYLVILWAYATAHFGGSSAAFGAQAESAFCMITRATIWYLLPVSTWIWAAAFTKRSSGWVRSALLLGSAIVPAFLFHAFLHVAAPDHTLFAVPAICIAGGALLSQLGRMSLPATGVAVALNVLLFLRAPEGPAESWSFRQLEQQEREISVALAAVDHLKRSGPVCMIAHDHAVPWRHLQYYHPDSQLVMLRSGPYAPGINEGAYLFMDRKEQMEISGSQEISISECATVALFLSGPDELTAGAELKARTLGNIVFLRVAPGNRFRLGSYRFAIAAKQ